ncbi:MAG: class I SAM-dependent methyltransferase [Dehalococcoidia bacterium]|nr:class I SAM-dependent methyltransferase [Dehalococcoidia bacterium]
MQQIDAARFFNFHTAGPWSLAAWPVSQSAAGLTATVLEGLPRGARVLDVGTGTGITARRLIAEGFQADGVDASPGMLAHAARLNGARYFPGDAVAIPAQRDQYDAAIYNYVFRYLTPEESSQAVKEAARVVRPGGLVVVSDLNLPHLRPKFLPVASALEDRLLGAWSDKPNMLAQFQHAGLALEDTRYPLLSFMYVFRRV